MVTLWESLEAVQAFVGPDWEQAVVPEEAGRCSPTRFVHHYESYAAGDD